MEDQRNSLRRDFGLEGLMVVFLRILALIFIFFGIRYWLLVVGVFDENIRFDNMSNHWKIASAVLSVLYPVAALGLWGLFSWGVVVWTICAAIEIVMYAIFPELFGQLRALMIFHAASIAAWLLIKLVQFLDKRRAQFRAVP